MSQQDLQRFQAFLSQLKADLRKAQEARDRVQEQLQSFEDLERNVRLLQQEGLRRLDTLVHLGCGVHTKAAVPDASRLFVDVGLGFHAECTLEEAAAVSAARLAHLRLQLEEHNRRVASIKASAALVGQGLSGLESGEATLARRLAEEEAQEQERRRRQQG